ncbi:hypothetical protein [Formosa algae]|uniref:Membrane-associated HD superfamily phosphohydrolase n=1 Tax=Formosa algae TaxID=225843 RepID=A0A9X1CA28_9FLAO|nr:hypothetical protein [Formosa algae]MBP1838412.1 membrane-associated HD superfamily phosphohydrolase [Formosa algae]MDQ0334547.1 membrane-associated HD superfamily phosphohydrolase [Formosa algae]OEI79092.1 hypothetical protein AST99_16410 [Formosa algae]PNW30131.1 hypothetical protein BKP44_00250 [Formosa algae]
MQKSISYIFHPIFMPLVGVLFYFSKSPRFIPLAVIQTKLVSLSILTLILPILAVILLKTLGRVNSIELTKTRERIIPLMIFCCILLIVIKRVITPYDFIELYYFFVGILASTISCLILNILNFKSSIHLMAISGVCMFFIGLSIHFSINILGSIALIIFIMGAVATSRLSLKAHNYPEILIGCATGLIPQLILIPNWL